MRVRTTLALLLLLAPAASVSFAQPQQQQPEPRLQHREEAMQEIGIYRPGRSNLPDEASGSYALSPNQSEVIEIILNGEGDQVRLQGYLTRIGDGASDRGASLTYFFARTTVSPSQLTFITRQVHGVWWSFSGAIERGSAQMSTEKGFYYLNGTLTEHFDNGQLAPQRVSLPSLPEGQLSQ